MENKTRTTACQGGQRGVLRDVTLLLLIQCITVGKILATDLPDKPRVLSLGDRVAAQRAIEEVYWRHRLWPSGNPQPGPSFDQAIPQSVIRAKVEDYLKKSNALERLWGRPITAQQLQAEMERMVRSSKRPAVLAELFAALGDDPFVIAETLARPVLADRLLREWYDWDQRFHGELRKQLESAQAQGGTAALSSLGGSYSETTFRLQEETQGTSAASGSPTPNSPEPCRLSPQPISGDDVSGNSALLLASAEWQEQVRRVAHKLAWQALDQALVRGNKESIRPTLTVDLEALPLQRPGPIQESPDAFTQTTLLDRNADSMTVATLKWPKAPFRTWWEGEKVAILLDLDVPSASYTPVNVPEGSCVDDTWTPTIQEAPDPRWGFSAVWTGTEMIVWGGSGGVSFNTGGRYDPATDTWVPTSVGANCPSPRAYHTAVWTGTKMIVWGGSGDENIRTNTGGYYDPSVDAWTPTSTGNNVPAARTGHTAVWTGTEMIVWGGSDGMSSLKTGSRFDPSADTWTPTSEGANAPTPRANHTAVWTGAEMIVWGGFDGALRLNTGARYSPTTNGWTPTRSPGIFGVRERHSAVWTGTEMIIWGGYSGFVYLNTGRRYAPATDSWVQMTSTDSPPGRANHSTIWSGTEMIVWGGSPGGSTNNGAFLTGGRYSPSTNSWSATSTVGVPPARYSHAAIWTGNEMLIWGGANDYGPASRGGRYSPTSDSWVPMRFGVLAPGARWRHSAVWTGTDMVIWGGTDGSPVNTGSRYDPALDTWSPTSTGVNVPAGRMDPAAVWTGDRMIVWGGDTEGAAFLVTGGLYDPVTDTWATMSTGPSVPSGRWIQRSVWTGSEMIVWGGADGSGTLNSGGRYSPMANTWTATSAVQAPSARYWHSLVWTGSEMIVWGGDDGQGGVLNSGGRYNPATDSWAPTSTAGAVPSARGYHTAIWTGTRMIVWGGWNGGSTLDSGGRYDPATDSWAATNAGEGVARNRSTHVAVWTGEQMIVWGGQCGVYLNSGGRYNPSTDTWTLTSVGTNVPTPRIFHTAVWTGEQMIVWGMASAGGLYCAQPTCSVTTWFSDADGDGRGNSNDSVLSCTQPPAYAALGADCDGSNGAVWSKPGEVRDLTFGMDKATLSWVPPLDPGAANLVYDTLRSSDESDFASLGVCVESRDGSDTTALDSELPAAGTPFFYLTRAENSCPEGTGTLGTSSSGQERTGLSCP